MNAMMTYQVNATISAFSVVVNTAPMSSMSGNAAYAMSARQARSSMTTNAPTVMTCRLRMSTSTMSVPLTMTVSTPYAMRVVVANAMASPLG